MQELIWFGVFIIVWFICAVVVVLWVTKKIVPEIEREMDEQGLNEIQKRLIISKAVFPPKFHK
jgi:hypothetical protein